MSAKAWRALAAADSQILWRDPLLGWVLLLPLSVALMLRVLIPPITDALANNGFRSGTVLSPHHERVSDDGAGDRRHGRRIHVA